MAQQRGRVATTSLDALFAERTTRLNNIVNYVGAIIPDTDEEPITGPIYNALVQEQKLQMCTNFSQQDLIDLVQHMQPFVVAASHRGPKPKSPPVDALICYLTWAKVGKEFDVLAKLVGMKPGRFEDNVNRIRPILNASLKERWWSSRARPTFRDQSAFPHCALIIDSHTTQCFRPKCSFNEAKIYWDGKNKIYGLKTEVAVSSTPPHYCLFTHKYNVASKHDYQNHKQLYTAYLEYLLKKPEEAARLPLDNHHRFFAAMLDKGYIGPEQDTPDFRRITPTKRPLTPQQIQHNDALNKERVVVECFFGRLTMKWAIMGETYRWDHDHFDLDITNCCLLTNHIIQNNQLVQADYTFYKNMCNMRYGEQLTKEEKRKEQIKRAKENRLAKLALCNPFINL
jgi:hypothetical protein